MQRLVGLFGGDPCSGLARVAAVGLDEALPSGLVTRRQSGSASSWTRPIAVEMIEDGAILLQCSSRPRRSTFWQSSSQRRARAADALRARRSGGASRVRCGRRSCRACRSGARPARARPWSRCARWPRRGWPRARPAPRRARAPRATEPLDRGATDLGRESLDGDLLEDARRRHATAPRRAHRLICTPLDLEPSSAGCGFRTTDGDSVRRRSRAHRRPASSARIRRRWDSATSRRVASRRTAGIFMVAGALGQTSWSSSLWRILSFFLEKALE
jgi:hypothetical protein